MPTSAKSKLVRAKSYWAIIEVYEPFRLGAEKSMVWYRYQVKGEPCKLVKGYQGFTYERNGKFRVHELDTGGLLVKGKTRAGAIAKARRDIARTPDFHEQFKALKPVLYREEIKDKEKLERMLVRCDKENL